jgi:hypothetical protein
MENNINMDYRRIAYDTVECVHMNFDIDGVYRSEEVFDYLSYYYFPINEYCPRSYLVNNDKTDSLL